MKRRITEIIHIATIRNYPDTLADTLKVPLEQAFAQATNGL
jgi:hypothetical protein